MPTKYKNTIIYYAIRVSQQMFIVPKNLYELRQACEYFE